MGYIPNDFHVGAGLLSDHLKNKCKEQIYSLCSLSLRTPLSSQEVYHSPENFIRGLSHSEAMLLKLSDRVIFDASGRDRFEENDSICERIFR